MRAQDVRHAVYFQKLPDDLRAEGVACAAGREGEFVALGIWVGPDEVGHGSFVGDLSEAVYDLYLVD